MLDGSRERNGSMLPPTRHDRNDLELISREKLDKRRLHRLASHRKYLTKQLEEKKEQGEVIQSSSHPGRDLKGETSLTLEHRVEGIKVLTSVDGEGEAQKDTRNESMTSLIQSGVQ